MNKESFNRIIDLILTNRRIGEGERDVLEKQRTHMKIKETNHRPGNKYWLFSVDKDANGIFPVQFRTLSVCFEERSQGIPIDCILLFKEGYIDALEVYSCDGTVFETINMENLGALQFSISEISSIQS